MNEIVSGSMNAVGASATDNIFISNNERSYLRFNELNNDEDHNRRQI